MPNEFIDTARRAPIYFFHVPKTGGTSLRAFLADQYLDSERCPAESWESLAKLRQVGLHQFRLFYGHFSVNLKEILPPATRTVTFLRDPISRTISTIRHMIRDPAFHPMHNEVKGRTLREVIYMDRIMRLLQNSQTKLLSFDVPIEDVLNYVHLQQTAERFVDIGELSWESTPAKALSAIESYDFVGIMDRFEDSLIAMCERFGFVPPEVMPDLNRASDTIDLERELNQNDVNHLRTFLLDDIQIYESIKEQRFDHGSRQKIFTDLMASGILSQVSRPFELDLGRPFVGSGWYEPELQKGCLRRWSGPAPKAQLYLPLKRINKCSLRIVVWKPHFLNEINAYIEGEDDVVARKTEDGGVLNIELDLPARPEGYRPPITTIVIDCKSVSQPSERPGSDLRPLGVLLTSVKVV